MKTVIKHHDKPQHCQLITFSPIDLRTQLCIVCHYEIVIENAVALRPYLTTRAE